MAVDFYKAKMEAAVADRVMLHVPYNFLPSVYTKDRDLMVKWVEFNRDRVVTLNFNEDYHLNEVDTTHMVATTETPKSSAQWLISYVVIDGQKQRAPVVNFRYDTESKNIPTISNLKIISSSGPRLDSEWAAQSAFDDHWLSSKHS